MGSPAEEEARERVRTAIQDYMVAADMFNDQEQLINHWAVIVNVEDVARSGVTRYAGFFHEPNLSPHIAKGLIILGLESMEAQHE